MNNPYGKLCAILAAADFSEKELHFILKKIKNENSSQLIIDVQNIARAINKENYRFGSFYDSPTFLPKQKNENSIADKIVEILVFEAGLSRGTAASLLQVELQKKYPSYLFPSLGKMAFAEWINKVAKQASPSELLHFAHAIKNRFIGNDKTDWSLKE